jgi:hypothetical protein
LKQLLSNWFLIHWHKVGFAENLQSTIYKDSSVLSPVLLPTHITTIAGLVIAPIIHQHPFSSSYSKSLGAKIYSTIAHASRFMSGCCTCTQYPRLIARGLRSGPDDQNTGLRKPGNPSSTKFNTPENWFLTPHCIPTLRRTGCEHGFFQCQRGKYRTNDVVNIVKKVKSATAHIPQYRCKCSVSA